MMRWLPMMSLRPSTLPVTPFANRAIEIFRDAENQLALRRRVDYGSCQWMLARSFQRCRQAQQFGFCEPIYRGHGRYLGFTPLSGFRSCRRPTCRFSPKRSKASAFLDQDTKTCTPANAHHDRHWGRKAQCAGACDDEALRLRRQGRGQSAVLVPISSTLRMPRWQCRSPRGRTNRKLRRPGAGWALASAGRPQTMRTICASMVIAADFSCLHDEATGLVHRPAYQLCTDLFGDGHRFTGDHRFINRTASFDKAAIDRDLFTGANPKPIPDDNHFQVDVLVDTVADAACRLGGQGQEVRGWLHRSVSRGLQLQNLSQQHQHRDDGCSFEIDGD